MAETKEREVMEPEFSFYQVTIELADEDENGKVKKRKEVHLVDAISPTEIDSKVAEEMKGTLGEWKIVAIQQSKIAIVY